jgi:hypothetical protein
MLGQVVETVRAAGMMVVGSAGNSGAAGCDSVDNPPAIYDAAYTVGATQNDAYDTIASFSSRGPVGELVKPDIVAPGVSVRSSIPGGAYGYKQGTSMASPHVVGVVALLWSAQPALRNQIDMTEAVLNETARHITTTACSSPAGVPNNVYGWGRIDALAAVQDVLDPIGYLHGTVQDGESLAGLAGVALQASLTPTMTRKTATGADGAYHFELLQGTYTVTASYPGYETFTHAGVVVTAEQTTTLTITLSCRLVSGANFTFSPQHPSWLTPVIFTGTVMTGTEPITYTWNFGDATPVLAGNPVTHTFRAESSVMPYRVVMTATNACDYEAATGWVTVRTYRFYLPLVVKFGG